MQERVAASPPARSFDETAAFYAALGFEVVFRGRGWMIVARGNLEIEFFPHPGPDPRESRFSACVRVTDADRLHREWRAASLPRGGIPRMTEPGDDPSGRRMSALVDPNGSPLRCMSPRDRG